VSPLAILATFDRLPQRETVALLREWIRELSSGRAQYEQDGEHLVHEAAARYSTMPIKHVVALALALAEMRMDMALSESYGEPASEMTAHRRKIELLESLLTAELEQIT